jgi:hypothetical protein
VSYSSGDPYVPPGRATEEVLPLTESFGAPHRPEAQIPPAYWGTQYHTVSCYGTIVSSFRDAVNRVFSSSYDHQLSRRTEQ